MEDSVMLRYLILWMIPDNAPEKTTGQPNQFAMVSLDDIESYCSANYSKYQQRIIIIVLARFDLDDVKAILRRHYRYWNAITGKDIDFFWIGYSAGNTHDKSKSENQKDLIEHFEFDNASFIKDMKRLEKLTDIHFKDELGLLLLDCYQGNIRYDKHIYLSIEKLAHQEGDTNLKKFFSYLIKVCGGGVCLDNVEKKVKLKWLVYNLREVSFSNILSIASFIKDIL